MSEACRHPVLPALVFVVMAASAESVWDDETFRYRESSLTYAQAEDRLLAAFSKVSA